jgi:putative Mg2+ transporter-C (MgtC) family protein
VEEAHLRSLLLHALSQGGLGLRRIDSSDMPDTLNVAITAQVVAARRNDAAVEQIVGRLSLEPHISAVAWQVDRTMPEAWATGSGFRQQAARMKTNSIVFLSCR